MEQTEQKRNVMTKFDVESGNIYNHISQGNNDSFSWMICENCTNEI